MDTESSTEKTVEKVSQVTRVLLMNMHEMWNQIYVMTDSLREQGENVILANIQDYFDEMLSCEQNKKQNLTEQVQKKLEECIELQKILNLSPVMKIDSHKPLTSILGDLKTKLEEIELVKQERLRQFQDLRDMEEDLCQALSIEPVTITNAVPFEEDLEKIELHIFQLEEEKLKRLEKYKQYRKEIEKFIRTLEISNLNDWENDLINGDSEFPLTDESMAKLSEVHQKYVNEVEAREYVINELLSLLKKLWDRLDVPEETREEFTSQLNGIGQSVKNKLESELSKCQAQRRMMLGSLINKVREEIEVTCDKLAYTPDMKRNCLFLDVNDSEELLDLLENKSDELELILVNCREIFDLYKKRDSLWQRMVVLEVASQDKNRLFSNRGGKLLKEEKERKAIDLALPKIQRELVNLLKHYEETYGSPFLFHGRNLLEEVTAEWEIRLTDKENFNAKKADSNKRKAAETEHSSKRTKVTTDQHNSLIASSSCPSSNKSGASGRSTRSQRSQANTSQERSIFTPTVFSYTGMSNISSYSAFQENVAGNPIVGAPVAHSSPTDRRGTFTVKQLSHLPRTPKTPAQTLRSMRTPRSGVPRPETPRRQPVLRSAAAATLSAPPVRSRTPGTPRPRPCALTLTRTPSSARQNNFFI